MPVKNNEKHKRLIITIYFICECEVDFYQKHNKDADNEPRFVENNISR